MATNRLLFTVIAALACSLVSGGCSTDEPGPADVGEVTPDAGPVVSCPTRLRMSVVSGGVVHLGWTGATHDNRFPLNAEFTVDITACDEECRACTFAGPIPDPQVNLQRCLTDSSVACQADSDCPPFQCVPTSSTTLGCANNGAPCATDTDCMAGECTVFLGANSASPIRPNCFSVVFRAPGEDTPVTGRIDLETGLMTFERFGLWIASSDVNRNPGFCPVCIGDDQRGDGNKGGVCSENPHGPTMGATLGQPCDAQSNSSIPALSAVYSLDCAVPMGPSFDLSTYEAGTAVARRWTLREGEQPACADGPCWCGLCAGTDQACHEDDDCAPGVACEASAQPGVSPPRSNTCVDECAWDAEALTGRCNGVVGLDEEGMPIIAPVPCLPSGDGAEVVVRGSSERLAPGSYTMVIGSVGCAGPSFSPAVSAALGLPGPNVSVYRLRVDLE